MPSRRNPRSHHTTPSTPPIPTTTHPRSSLNRWELAETAKRLLLASFFALPFMGHGTIMQLFVALVFQLVFLVLQVYAAPFKRLSDNYWALTVNVMLVFVFFCCLVLEVDDLVEATEGVLQKTMRSRFYISVGSVTALLFCSTLFVLVATLLILLRSLAAIRQQPLLRWRSDSSLPELPPTDGWHALISHAWGSAQDQARVLKERLSLMLPGVQLFLECAQPEFKPPHWLTSFVCSQTRCFPPPCAAWTISTRRVALAHSSRLLAVAVPSSSS